MAQSCPISNVGQLSGITKSRHRLQLAERPMFHNWIEYVDSLPESADRVDPDQVKAAALEAFGKQDELQEIEEGLDLGRRVKTKFNGKLAMAWTKQQVTGRPLGELTASLKAVYPLTRLDDITQDESRKPLSISITLSSTEYVRDTTAGD
ncbi:hypothetical protein ABBQ32_006500 [Trebouxia sp. C0010 RCD-2024]